MLAGGTASLATGAAFAPADDIYGSGAFAAAVRRHPADDGDHIPAGAPSPWPEFFDSPPTILDRTGAVELEGRMIGPVWELMSGNPDQVAT